jgi:hypothetical protein
LPIPSENYVFWGDDLWVSAAAALRQLRNRQAICIKANPLGDVTVMTSNISPTNISQWLQTRLGPLAMWAVTIVVALILFFVTEGSSYHQLVMGFLASAIALCVALSLFEAAWQAVTAMLGVSAD